MYLSVKSELQVYQTSNKTAYFVYIDAAVNPRRMEFIPTKNQYQIFGSFKALF